MKNRFRLMGALLVGAAVLAPLHARAQPAWPGAKPITMVVPFTAGGSLDATARLLAEEMSKQLKQSVVVENVAGAGGTIGVGRVAKAAPDGYTLVMGADSPVAIAKYVNPAGVSYDPAKDLTPVALVNTAPMVLVARPDLPVSNLAELQALGRKEGSRLSYATSGVGTVLHLGMEMIKQAGKLEALHVPYRGGAQIATDTISGQVDLAMLVSASAAPHVKSGKLKGIAVTGGGRPPLLPGLPAVAETPGFEGYDVVTWAGLFAPAHTPKALVDRINQAVNAVLAQPDVRAKLQSQGATPGQGDAAAFARFVASEQQRYAQVVQRVGIRLAN